MGTNKRAYGADEPVDPPRDNASEASPNRRGPIAGSKRVSLSPGSAGRDTTSVMNDTCAIPHPSTTSPGLQDSGGDPSVSTPEKTDGLETGDSSPAVNLTGIFGGASMPITTNDLGRLPLHHGVKFRTDFDFQAIANGWNGTGSGRAPTNLDGVDPNPGPGQGEGVNSRGSLYPPQEQHPEDLFPWIPYTTTDSIPTMATTRSNVAPAYVAAGPSQTKPAADQLDSTISSLFGDVPSTSSTALGLTAGLSLEPASSATENHMDMFGTLFPLTHTPVETRASTTVQTTQPSLDGHGERGYESLPVDPQAYLHGWSNVPQAFE